MAENASENSKTLRQELENEVDTWERYCYISHYGLMTATAAWMSYLAWRMLSSRGDMFARLVLGLWAAFRPWAVWVVKALKLDLGFEIDHTTLLLSGVTFCLFLVDDFFHQNAQRAWDNLEDARDEEERRNEQG